jgi:hypothetical protein
MTSLHSASIAQERCVTCVDGEAGLVVDVEGATADKLKNEYLARRR